MKRKKFVQTKAVYEITLPIVDAQEFWADEAWTGPLRAEDKKKKNSDKK